MASGNDLGALMRSVRGPPMIGLTGSGRRRRRGGNIFSKIGNWVKGAANTVYNKAIKPAAKFVKDQHVLSTVAGFIPHPAGKAAAVGLKLAGLGRRRRRVKRRGGSIMSPFRIQRPIYHRMTGIGRRRRVRRKGGSIASLLKKAHSYVKEKRLISSALKHFKYNRAGNAVAALGYGRRRTRVVRRRRVGGSVSSFLKKAHRYVKDKRLISNALKHFKYSRAGNAVAALGYGRRRRTYRRRR